MSTVDDATATMIGNFPARTGRPLDEWVAMVRADGMTKHGEIMTLLKSQHGMSHGFANLVALTALKPEDVTSPDDLVEAMYAGPKAGLRPLHDAAIEAAQAFGADVELAPKKAYVSLRRKKQFGTVGPASGGRLEIGLNLRDVQPAGRLEATTGMCTHRVRIASRDELDGELLGWLRQAYEGA
jgi:Domain of unknown function (DUF4287)/Domain of unknown function (DUF5655)